LRQSTREKAIDAYDMSFIWERGIADGKFHPKEIVILEREFKRFLKLVLRDPGPLAMISKRVDEVWHLFILFTPQYRAFCKNVMGFFVDHQPLTSKTPVPIGAIPNFLSAYRKHFGRLPSVWFEGIDPKLKLLIKKGTVPSELAFQWSGWTGARKIADGRQSHWRETA